MNTFVFLDTVGLIAVWESKDQWHSAAVEASTQLCSEKTQSISTSYILAECANAAARKPYREDVSRLREELEDAGQLIHPTTDEWESAWVAYRRGEGGDASLVDHLSFLVMRRLGITRAFTNDRHFQAAGFETLF